MNLPLDKIIYRGEDPTGHGHFGAKRGKKKHKGLDIVTAPGEPVLSMIDGKITKIGYCYSQTRKFRYIEVTNKEYRIRLLYALPRSFKVGDEVCAGDYFGTAQDIAVYWGNGMLNHLHVEIYKNGLLVDPEPIIELLKSKT